MWLLAVIAVTSLTLLAYSIPALVPGLLVLLPASLIANLACWIDAYLCGRTSTSQPLRSPLWRYLVAGDRFICHKRVRLARWDIVVFHPPRAPSQRYVFRIAGMPGEKIEILDGRIHVTGAAPAPPPPGLGPYLSEVPPFATRGPGSTGTPITLASDEYYLLGDDTAGAADSRFFVRGYAGHQRGAVPRDQIVGRATYIYWPVARWRRF